jgi:hypothetical protein
MVVSRHAQHLTLLSARRFGDAEGRERERESPENQTLDNVHCD